MDGIIYVLRIIPPLFHARYYVGWCKKNGLWNRLKQHRTGHGAHITKAAIEQGHRLELIAEFPGTRNGERWIKNQKNTPKLVQRWERLKMLNHQRQKAVTIQASNVTRSARNKPSPTELTYYDLREDENLMALDLSHIDLASLIEKDANIKLKHAGKSKVGPCPFCGEGEDRFSVWPDHFKCRKCGKGGDAINYLVWRRGITFSQACKELGVTLAGSRPNSRTVNRPISSDNQPTHHNKIAPERESPAFTDPAWMVGAMNFSFECQQRLMSPAGEKAVEYLIGRGLTMETIEDACIGYNHKDRTVFWGKEKVFAPQGIVFPWHDARDGLRRVAFRCSRGPIKYRLADGSAMGFYLGDRILTHQHVIIVEGEIDALTIWQAYERSGLYCPVAIGSAYHGRIARLIARLGSAKTIRTGFDADEAGQSATLWWTSINSKIQALRPLLPLKDVNGLYLAALQDPENDGKPSLANAAVRAWIEGND